VSPSKGAASPARILALIPEGAQAPLAAAASACGLELVVAPDVRALLEALQGGAFQATLLSLSRDPMDEALARSIGEQPHSGTLILSAPGVSLERALLMERAGAVALLREPLQEAEVAARLAAVVDEGPDVPIPEATDPDAGRPRLVGSGAGMGEVFETLARVARSPSTVLVTGESGTGKEEVARALHWASDRRDAPFVAVNCAAIPEHLLESELFGHERGAFTGAVTRRTGRFQRARGGTLFLDEIGDMSLVLQAKILRVLEERRVEPVGGDEVDARIVAATNQDLAGRIAEGRFREDLYYRLAVVQLHLPPLRERGSDVRELALHFAADFARRYDRPVRAITEAALLRLAAHGWPGNVRELRNVIDRAVLLSTGAVLHSGELRLGAGSPRASGRAAGEAFEGYPPSVSLEQVEADHVRRVLASVGGHMGKAAEVLGIHRNTLTRKVQDYGLGGDDGGGA
jgi:DNA-binding NtrC family response regulator